VSADLSAIVQMLGQWSGSFRPLRREISVS
jgi:hypothetical protein